MPAYISIPLCPVLIFHPDIVFFGENLPVRFFTSMKMVRTWQCMHACVFKENVMQYLCRNTLFSLSLSTCQDFPRCDLLIIMGTSLQVQPFAGLVSRYCISSVIFLQATADHRHSCSDNLAVCCSLAAGETILQNERFRLDSSKRLVLWMGIRNRF